MAGETKVILQAASDAWMGASSTVYAINVSTGKGATTLTPLIQMTNGLCIPSGTTIQVADTLEPTINGNVYQVSNVQGSGGTSYFNGSDFYLRDLDGSGLGSETSARAQGGMIHWFFGDDDPRKMYGLPYHYVAHKGTHQTAWTTGDQDGRGKLYALENSSDEGLKKQEFIYRTKWDYIAPAKASMGGGMVKGYGFADTSNSFKKGGTIVTKCEAVSGEDYEAIIHTNQPHWAEVGDLFTTRDFNSSKLASLVVDIGGGNVSTVPDVTSVFQVYSVLDKLRFTAYKTANQNSKTHLALDCTTTGIATTGTGRGAKVVFEGKATHSDDYFSTPSRMPTTTKFQLNVTDISHTFDDLVAVTPMMKAQWNGTLHEQIQTLGYSMGMRKESMKFTGTLRDTGPISATNLRKQVLMNICRTQWLKISGLWGGKNPESEVDSSDGYTHSTQEGTDFRGGGNSGPTNPRSYPCITIYDPSYQSSSDSKLVDLNPDGGYNIYRGIIRSLSFTQVGGRPDIWDWTMDFVVMSNEKPASGTLAYEAPEESEEE